jgi:hypothetical protein
LIYNYYELRVGRERNAQRLLADQVYGGGGEGILGVFAPLLGYASNEALVLTDARVSPDAVLKGSGVAAAEWRRMSPTLRPHEGATPEPGGIYAAWIDFETRFAAKIYGLFAVEPTAAEAAAGSRQLLLMTRYTDLAEWQKSRDPTSEAMKSFLKRRELTRVSLARACVLIPREAQG